MPILFIVIIAIFGFIILLAELYSLQKKEYQDSQANSKINSDVREWWAKRRRIYNLGLVFAGILAFGAYSVVGETLIAPYDSEFEITLFTIIFQGIGYLFMILIANLFYNLGYYADKRFNKKNSIKYRQRLFSLGFWFSVALPFSIPVILIIQYFTEFYRK